MDKEIWMLVKVERPNYGGDHFHVTAHPIYRVNEGGYWMPRSFVQDTWPEDEAKLHDLMVRSQGDLRTEEPVYGWSVEYWEPLSVGLRRAEIMLKELKRINRRLEAMSERLGHAESFAGYIARVALIIGAEGFCFDERGNRHEEVTGESWRWVTGDSLAFQVDERTKALRASRKPFEVALEMVVEP